MVTGGLIFNSATDSVTGNFYHQPETTRSLLFATPSSEKRPSRETIETTHDVQSRSTLVQAAHDFAGVEPAVSPAVGVPVQASSLSLPVQFESSDVSASNHVGKARMPAYFAATCPLTQRAMSEPVVASDGYVYERGAIEEWMRTRTVSPVTREPFAHMQLVSTADSAGFAQSTS